MAKATVSKKEWDYLVCPPEIAQAVLEKAGYDYKGCLIYQGSKAVNPYTEQRETVLTWTTVGYMLKDKKLIDFEEDWQSVKAVKEFYNSINEGYMEMDLNEALEKLEKAGLIAEETTEQALARMAANSYEGQVDEIVSTIEKVKPVKNYYEVDPDEDYVKAQFEIVMQDDTVWEVQFRKGHGFWWGGNVYPWRIIKNNNGGFTQVAFSLSMLRAYMKKVKAIQSESVNESTDDYREIVTKKLAQIYDNCYDSDDAGRSYAEKQVADFEPQIAEVLEEGGDAPVSPYEVAEVIWYILHHSQLSGRSILGVWQKYTRNDPDYFSEWYQFNP